MASDFRRENCYVNPKKREVISAGRRLPGWGGILEHEEEDEGEEGEWREWRGGLEGEPGEASLTSTDLAASPESPLLPSPEGVKVGIQQRICGTEQPDGGRRQNPLCWGYSLVPRVGPMLWVCPLPHTVTLG